ncbi:MAG: hypothetical protein K2J84_08865 [Bacteroidaceae bacterium]|nr:hypothetical protein [Bacteroidaceae bacterium]
MKTYLLTNLFMLISLCIGAQTEISEDNPQNCTSYIVNPSFENGTEGWKSANLQSQSNNDFPKTAGAKYMEKWVQAGSAVGNGSASQVLSDLPIGKYKLVVGAQNLDQNNKTSKKTGAVIYAGGQKTNVYTPDDYSVYFTYISGEVEIGFKAENAQGNWIAVDNFRLYLIDEVEADLLIEELSKIIADAETRYDENKTGAETLKAEIDKAKELVTKSDEAPTSENLVAEIHALNEAIATYRKKNVSEEDPLDYTSYIVNPSFENSTNGWETTNMQSQTNSSFTKKSGSTYMEKWVTSGSVGDGSVRQTITGLPNGIYKLTAAAQNYTQSSTSKKNTGAYIYAGAQQEIVYTPNDYSVKFTSIVGETEIGFVAENATGNWICVDNFRLYLIGELTADDLMEELNRLITNAESLQSSMMSATAANTLKTANDAAKQLTATTETESFQSTVRNLNTAIKAASVSIGEYQALATKIAAVEQSYDATKEGAADLQSAIDHAKELATNAETTSDELAAEIATLDKALLAFNLANATPGTGTAPKVTVTNHYVATGATQALMRATTAGSNVLERGVCWSTEHNPTVLDNRSTKSFTLNGTIFHITGMQPATVYYLRPYVMNKTYTVAYGDEVKIVTHPKGTCTWSWDEAGPDNATNDRCRQAIQETIEYFNEWTGIMGFHLSGHYVPGAGAGGGTADCSYGGYMRISQNQANQAIGTVLHETGHGVGVGTQERYSNTNLHDWRWFGRETNTTYQFLENKMGNSEYVFQGDGTHAWGNNASYDWLVNGAHTDTHQELQYIGGMCILHGMFIDGLDPTSSGWWYTDHNGIAGYTYNFDDAKKYYLMCKDAERGLGEGLLYQRAAASVAWKPCLTDEALSDSAAWYMEYNAKLGYYMFKNAATGRYLSHASGITAKSLNTPTTNERFQLMPDRTDVTLGKGKSAITTHGYWLTWTNDGFKAMNANAINARNGYGTLSQDTFNFSDAATKQQWIIISEDELEAYQAYAVATGIRPITINDSTMNGDKKVVGIYTTGGIQLQATQKGFNIIKYNDGSSTTIYVK